MAAKKRTKKQSLAEFRAWLEGVEELQPEGWAPNANQWKLIRAKIDGIKESAIVEKVIESSPTVNNTPHPQRALQPSMIPTAPPVGGVPAGQVTIAPNANPMFNAEGGKTQTPNIDTSDGNVTSSFV